MIRFCPISYQRDKVGSMLRKLSADIRQHVIGKLLAQGQL